jgi:hypothetical protein
VALIISFLLVPLILLLSCHLNADQLIAAILEGDNLAINAVVSSFITLEARPTALHTSLSFLSHSSLITPSSLLFSLFSILLTLISILLLAQQFLEFFCCHSVYLSSPLLSLHLSSPFTSYPLLFILTFKPYIITITLLLLHPLYYCYYWHTQVTARGDDLKSLYWRDLLPAILPHHRAIYGLNYHGSNSVTNTVVQTLHRFGCGVDEVDKTGSTALHTAITTCRSE